MALLEQLDLDTLERIDQGGDLWHEYRQACKDSLYFLAKSVLSTLPAHRNLISVRAHLPMALALQAVNEGAIQRLLLELPRNFLKSTFATQARPIHKLILRVMNGEDPDDRFLFRSCMRENAERFWGVVKSSFETNEFFQFLFPELIPNFENVELWNKSSGQIPCEHRSKEPTFDCVGGGGIATSRHHDDITEEDLINQENYDSPTAVAKAIDTHRQSEHLLDPSGGAIVTVGNRWDFFDLNHTIHTEEPDTVILSASASRAYKLEGKYRCRNLPENVMELCERFSGDLLWPEAYSQEDLGRLLLKNKARVFMSQMENDPADPESMDFKLDWVKSCKVVNTDLGPAVKYEDDPEPMAFMFMNLYLTWDPGTDGKSGRSRNAVTLVGADHKKRVTVLREYVKKEDPRKTVDVFLAFFKRYQGYIKSTGIEEEVFAKVLGDILRDKSKEKGLFVNVKRLKVPKNMAKDQRIRMWFGTYCENGQVYICDRCPEVLDEYAHFGSTSYTRDAIDAVAHATQLIKWPMSPKQMARMEEDQERVHQDRGITGYGSALA